MFDELLPPLYLQLRIRSGLSQTRLAAKLGVSRHTVANYESGSTKPDADYVRGLTELAECSQIEVVQMLCELLGELIDRPVVILEPQEAEPEEPPSVLEGAEKTAREFKRFIAPSMFRALANQIHVTGMMKLTLERQTADLAELAADCRAAVEPPAPRRKATPKGATGPLGPVLDSRTDGTPPGRSQSTVQPENTKGNAR